MTCAVRGGAAPALYSTTPAPSDAAAAITVQRVLRVDEVAVVVDEVGGGTDAVVFGREGQEVLTAFAFVGGRPGEHFRR